MSNLTFTDIKLINEQILQLNNAKGQLLKAQGEVEEKLSNVNALIQALQHSVEEEKKNVLEVKS